jgi:hypothetical protein
LNVLGRRVFTGFDLFERLPVLPERLGQLQLRILPEGEPSVLAIDIVFVDEGFGAARGYPNTQPLKTLRPYNAALARSFQMPYGFVS